MRLFSSAWCIMKQVTAMLARTADGAMIIDRQGKVTFWNRAAERLFGLRSDEVFGRPCHEVLCGETLGGRSLCSPSCAIATRLTRGGVVRNFNMQVRTQAGRLLWLNVSSLPIPTRKRGEFRVAHLFRDITKQAQVRRLVDELHAALCPPVAGSQEVDPPMIHADLPLSKREREILRLLALGKDTKRMADSLCVSPATVRNHVQHILEKLGAHSRLQALAIAFGPHEHPA